MLQSRGYRDWGAGLPLLIFARSLPGLLTISSQSLIIVEAKGAEAPGNLVKRVTSVHQVSWTRTEREEKILYFDAWTDGPEY
ncbi:MAG: hypothetical protein KDK23_12065 [Leptospiraceae bacterium]|nr:hypothetical protein [Leptospiraceae bacterium]